MFPSPIVLEYNNTILPKNKGLRTQVSSIPGAARTLFGFAQYGTNLYIYGGYGVSGSYTNEFWKYDTSTDIWTQLANGPLNIQSSALASYDNKIYSYGGNASGLTNRFFVYDISTDTWTENTTSASKPSARTGKMIQVNNKFYHTAENGKTFITYDIASDTWSTLANSPVNFQLNGGICSDGVKVYCTGTLSSNSSFYSLMIYDIQSNTWESMSSTVMGDMVYNPQSESVYCTMNRRLYILNNGNTWEELGTGNSNIINSRGGIAMNPDGTGIYSLLGQGSAYYATTAEVYQFI